MPACPVRAISFSLIPHDVRWNKVYDLAASTGLRNCSMWGGFQNGFRIAAPSFRWSDNRRLKETRRHGTEEVGLHWPITWRRTCGTSSLLHLWSHSISCWQETGMSYSPCQSVTSKGGFTCTVLLLYGNSNPLTCTKDWTTAHKLQSFTWRGFLRKLGFTCPDTSTHRIHVWNAANPHAVHKESFHPQKKK
jgi:hypothetical protein